MTPTHQIWIAQCSELSTHGIHQCSMVSIQQSNDMVEKMKFRLWNAFIALCFHYYPLSINLMKDDNSHKTMALPPWIRCWNVNTMKGIRSRYQYRFQSQMFLGTRKKPFRALKYYLKYSSSWKSFKQSKCEKSIPGLFGQWSEWGLARHYPASKSSITKLDRNCELFSKIMDLDSCTSSMLKLWIRNELLGCNCVDIVPHHSIGFGIFPYLQLEWMQFFIVSLDGILA